MPPFFGDIDLKITILEAQNEFQINPSWVLHWSLDVVMNDDQHRAERQRARQFAALRRIALGIIKANTAKGSNA